MLPGEILQQGQTALVACDFSAARHHLSALLEVCPDIPEYWFLLGAAEHGAQQLPPARTAFERCLALNPSHLQACFALSAVCLSQNDLPAALRFGQQATLLAPDNPQSQVNLAIIQEAQGNFDSALRAYDLALRLDPRFADALKNRGALLLSLGRLEEALRNNRAFAEVHPLKGEAQFNLGDACLAADRFDEAAQAFQKALALTPDHPRYAIHAGFALALIEDFDTAQKYLDHAAQLDPGLIVEYRNKIFGPDRNARPHLDARTLFLLRQFERVEQCDWRSRQHFVQRFIGFIHDGQPLTDMALAFRAMVMGLPPAAQLKLARQIAGGFCQGRAVAPPFSRPSAVQPSGTSPRRLRIAYLSPDFRVHALTLLVRSLFSLHDRNRFEIFGYALGGNDGSALRQRLVESFDHFTDLDALNDAQAADVIASHGIDILVDLAGYLNQARPGILARRPAPLTLSWEGYLATTGAPWIDYVLADPIALPDGAENEFSEKVIRINQSLLYCAYASDALKKAPSRSLAGLPENGLILAAMHNPYKIDPDIFALWMRLLARSPHTSLWLLGNQPKTHANLCQAAQKHGVDAGRLIFAPLVEHTEHLARLQLADLALDTPQCNGVTTTADALAAGVPVITCPGASVIQRMASSLLHSAGLDELVTRNLGHYEELALDILDSPQRLRQIKQKLHDARSSAPFFHPQHWVREFETVLLQIWQRHLSDPPAPTPKGQVESHGKTSPPFHRITAIY